jgi:hypothetical protein
MMPSCRLVALLAGLVVLAGCRGSEPPEPAPTPSPTAALPQLPQAEPPLDRRALLLAVGQAASDFALGRDDLERQRRLDGRRFEVVLRFGCEGDDLTTRQWTFDEETRVLRINVDPDVTTRAEAVTALGFEEFEAVEGFWIRQPWLLEADCPVRAARPAAEEDEEEEKADDESSEPAALPPRIGLAHFFTAEDSRTQRREGRGYRSTVRLGPDETPSASGYDLVLSGRLKRLPDGRTIACTPSGFGAPPACIVSVSFDHVRIRRPDGVRVAEWSRG